DHPNRPFGITQRAKHGEQQHRHYPDCHPSRINFAPAKSTEKITAPESRDLVRERGCLELSPPRPRARLLPRPLTIGRQTMRLFLSGAGGRGLPTACAGGEAAAVPPEFPDDSSLLLKQFFY